MRAAIAALILAAPAAAAPVGVNLVDIGVAAAVKGSVQAVAPGQAKPVGRVIGSGKALYLNDEVKTGKGGRLQILLLDETTFTIGPDAAMTLDEFVYDPETNKGKVSAQISKGAFRFVTGKIAKREVGDMKVKLPTGTIGIRGTITDGVVHANGDADVALGGPGPENNAGEDPGGITVSNGSGSVDIDQSGYMTSIRGANPPTPPTRVTPEFQKQTDLTGAGEQGGGAANSGGGSSGGGTSAETEGEQGSAADQSGDSTAHGGQSAELLFQDQESEQEEQQQVAAQQNTEQQNAVADYTPSNWADVQLLTGGGGNAGYQATSNYTCSAGCSGGGEVQLRLEVDFTNKTVGGANSRIDLLTGPLNDNGTNISQLSYASMTSGSSALSLNSALDNVAFTSAALKFLNKGGKAAGAAEVSFSYSTSGNQTSGTIKADLGEVSGGQ